MKNQTTGQTENIVTQETDCNECNIRNMGTIEDIWDSHYDEEMETCHFTVTFYNGETQTIGLTPRHIKEMLLFLKKEEAEQLYFKHLIRK
jgi:hypothetical protein